MIATVRRVAVLALALCVGLAGAPQTDASDAVRSRVQPSWRSINTGLDNDFRGLSAVDDQVAWVSGHGGVILRTTNRGRNWKDVSPTGASKLEFRDITAYSREDAVAMAAGPLRRSRLYITHDGGRHWRVAYTNRTKGVFFDCMSFSDAQHGLVMSDPVDGKFAILATVDSGENWSAMPRSGMPKALKDEYGFAASGQCLTTLGNDAWFGTGGARARVFHSGDGGLTWTVRRAHIASSPSAGVFALAFKDPSHGVAVGGDFAEPDGTNRVAAVLANDAWTAAARMPSGYRSGVTFVPGTPRTAISVGLTGSDVSFNGGQTWRTFAHGSFNTVMCTADGSCWASGPDGKVGFLLR